MTLEAYDAKAAPPLSDHWYARLFAPPERRTVPSEAPSRTPAWIVGGVGVSALAVGSVFGALTFQAKSASAAECRGVFCSQKGVDLNHEAHRNALVSDVCFGAAGVALGVSLFLFLRATPAKAPSTAQPARPPG